MLFTKKIKCPNSMNIKNVKIGINFCAIQCGEAEIQIFEITNKELTLYLNVPINNNFLGMAIINSEVINISHFIVFILRPLLII